MCRVPCINMEVCFVGYSCRCCCCCYFEIQDKLSSLPFYFFLNFSVSSKIQKELTLKLRLSQTLSYFINMFLNPTTCFVHIKCEILNHPFKHISTFTTLFNCIHLSDRNVLFLHVKHNLFIIILVF